MSFKEGTPDREALLLALKNLRWSDRFEAEIGNLLGRHGFDRPVIDKVLAQLREWRYIDDEKLARSVVEKRKNNKYGKERIRQQLIDKGVDEQLSALLLATISPEDELSSALELLARKAKPGIKPEACARHLANRGFDEETIIKALSSFFPDFES